MENQEHPELEDLQEIQAQTELQERMVKMELVETLVFLDAVVLRESVVLLENLVPQDHQERLVLRGLKERLDHLASKEKRDVVEWMAVQENPVNEENRAIKDPKVRKERWGLLARRETKAGQACLDPLDPRVTRATKDHQEQMDQMDLQD